jgi:hypothetical protein
MRQVERYNYKIFAVLTSFTLLECITNKIFIHTCKTFFVPKKLVSCARFHRLLNIVVLNALEVLLDLFKGLTQLTDAHDPERICCDLWGDHVVWLKIYE